jgi:hypothetical protein
MAVASTIFFTLFLFYFLSFSYEKLFKFSFSFIKLDGKISLRELWRFNSFAGDLNLFFSTCFYFFYWLLDAILFVFAAG